MFQSLMTLLSFDLGYDYVSQGAGQSEQLQRVLQSERSVML